MEKVEMTPEKKQKKIEELTDRIEELQSHRSMWGHAGGMGGSMAMKASQELHDLENGTNSYEIYKLEMNLRSLKARKEDAILLKKYLLSKKIKSQEEELNRMKTIDEEIEKEQDLESPKTK